MKQSILFLCLLFMLGCSTDKESSNLSDTEITLLKTLNGKTFIPNVTGSYFQESSETVVTTPNIITGTQDERTITFTDQKITYTSDKADIEWKINGSLDYIPTSNTKASLQLMIDKDTSSNVESITFNLDTTFSVTDQENQHVGTYNFPIKQTLRSFTQGSIGLSCKGLTEEKWVTDAYSSYINIRSNQTNVAFYIDYGNTFYLCQDINDV
jgi:hypothetical protein